MMRTCGVYCGAVFMCILAAALYANLLLVADIPSSPSSIKSLAAINNLIDATKYELFSVSFADKSARFFSGGTDAASVPVTSYRTDDTIVEIVDKRLPIVLTGSSASSWNALKWDIWELAKKFPLLLGVVVQKDGDASPMLLQHDREPGGMITEAAAVQPAETVEELLLINFLLSFKSAPVRMFYSTDFRIFQRMVQVSVSCFSVLTYRMSLMRFESGTGRCRLARLCSRRVRGCQYKCS